MIVAVLEAGEINTSYRRYKIPSEWKCKCVEALLKLAATHITNDESLVVIDNILGLAYMIKSIQSAQSGGSGIIESIAYRNLSITELSNQWREYMPATKANPLRLDIGARIEGKYNLL